MVCRKSDRVENEVVLFGQETSFLNDFDAYQEAAVAAGFIMEVRLFSQQCY